MYLYLTIAVMLNESQSSRSCTETKTFSGKVWKCLIYLVKLRNGKRQNRAENYFVEWKVSQLIFFRVKRVETLPPSLWFLLIPLDFSFFISEFSRNSFHTKCLLHNIYPQKSQCCRCYIVAIHSLLRIVLQFSWCRVIIGIFSCRNALS